VRLSSVLACVAATLTLHACAGNITGEGVVDCGLGGVPSRCAAPELLERCNGPSIEQVDCTLTGEVCGPDPSNPSAATCIGDGDPCGEIGAEGMCSGAVLVTCTDGGLATANCAEAGEVCGFLEAASANVCATECEFAAVTETGNCASDSERVWCASGVVESQECPQDTRCFAYADGPLCQTSDEACGVVGPQGRCADGVLVHCDGDWPELTDCAAAGQVCTYVSHADGYGCASASVTGAMEVSGVVEFEKRPVSPSGLGAIAPAPARGAAVYVLRDSDDQVLAEAVTANDGSFVLHYDETAGTSVRVTAATRSDVSARPARVENSSGDVHAFRSTSFAAADHATASVLATESSGEAQAFNVFDNLVRGLDFTRDLGAQPPLVALSAEYTNGSGTSSYYDGTANEMFIAGGSDDDGYDDIVTLHEFGHYHQDEYGASDNPGGPHPSNGGDDPTLAWGEGQASYIAMVISGMPHYVDTNTGGGWSVDLENEVHGADLADGDTQYIYEWMVAELMWDVGDAGQDQDGDPVTADHRDAMMVTTTYLVGPDYVGRGVTGIDLVDWLDGWFLRMGLGGCVEMRQLVHDWYEFPYDFAGPAGSCP